MSFSVASLSVPSVSVVIPAYNAQAFIARAVHSALAQKFPASEIIVVDDGSTDGTLEILKKFGERIKVLRIPHAGVSAARNEGVRQASGEYIAFLDSDDLWFKNRLKSQMEYFYRFPDAGFSACNFVTRTPNRCLLRQYSRLKDKSLRLGRPLHRDAVRRLLKENFIGSCSAVIARRDALLEAGLFDPSYTHSEDYDLWLRMAQKTAVIPVPETLFYKRAHENNLTRDLSLYYAGHLQVLRDQARRYAPFFKTRRLIKVLKSAQADFHYLLGNFYFDTGRRLEAFAQYFEALESRLSLNNLLSFTSTVSKKTLRVLTSDRLSRHQLLEPWAEGLRREREV